MIDIRSKHIYNSRKPKAERKPDHIAGAIFQACYPHKVRMAKT